MNSPWREDAHIAQVVHDWLSCASDRWLAGQPCSILIALAHDGDMPALLVQWLNLFILTVAAKHPSILVCDATSLGDNMTASICSEAKEKRQHVVCLAALSSSSRQSRKHHARFVLDADAAGSSWVCAMDEPSICARSTLVVHDAHWLGRFSRSSPHTRLGLNLCFANRKARSPERFLRSDGLRAQMSLHDTQLKTHDVRMRAQHECATRTIRPQLMAQLRIGGLCDLIIGYVFAPLDWCCLPAQCYPPYTLESLRMSVHVSDAF